MYRTLFFLLLVGLQYSANAQLFTRYALGVSGIIERGIRTPRAMYYSTPMVYGANIMLLTEDNKNRFFVNVGVGITNYRNNYFFRAPIIQDPMSMQQFLPKSSMSDKYSFTHINLPLTIGYKIIHRGRIHVYASTGVDLRFQLASKSNYVVRDSTEQILFERTTTDLPYLKKLQLFTVSIGVEYKSTSGRWIYRIEPFLKVDSRKFFKPDYLWLGEFLTYAGGQISCYYQLKRK